MRHTSVLHRAESAHFATMQLAPKSAPKPGRTIMKQCQHLPINQPRLLKYAASRTHNVSLLWKHELRLRIASTLMADLAERSDFCRVCFGEDEPQKDVSGYLVAPCNCIGSVQHIHLRCLRTWQATQRAQGRHDKANLCELCGSKYALPRHIIKQEADTQGHLQRLHLTLRHIWHWLNAKSAGPFSQEALRYWRNALLVAGLYKGTLWGIVGLVAGGQVGITSASRGACCLARCAPGLMVTAMIFPRLQVPLMMTSVMAGCGLAAGAATLAIAGAYCGAFYGFFSGALGFMKWAAITHLETAAVGGKCVTLTVSAVGKIAVAVGLRLFKCSQKAVLL